MAVDLPSPGAEFISREGIMTAEEIHDFASSWDPQPMHLDKAAAERSVFGQLVASGWHTAAMTVRLAIQRDILEGRLFVGLEVNAMKFVAPVVAGDRLCARMRVISVRPTSDGERAVLVLGVETVKGDGSVVMTQEWTMLVEDAAGVNSDA